MFLWDPSRDTVPLASQVYLVEKVKKDEFIQYMLFTNSIDWVQLDSSLFWTAPILTQRCPGQHPLSAVPDSVSVLSHRFESLQISLAS